MKSRRIVCIPADVTASELRQKVQEHRIICCAVNLVNDQYDRFFSDSAPILKDKKQIIQYRRMFFGFCNFLQCDNNCVRNPCFLAFPDCLTAECLYKLFFSFEAGIA